MSFMGDEQGQAERLEALLDGVGVRRYLAPTRVWHCRVDANWHTRHPIHIDDHRLLLIRSGRGRYRVAGQEFPLRRGVVVFVSAGSVFEQERDLRALPQIVACRFHLHDSATGAVVPGPTTPFHIAHDHADLQTLEPLFLQLAAAFDTRQTAGRAHVAMSCLHLIMANIGEGIQQRACEQDDDMEQIKSALKADPLAPVSWPRVAASIGLSTDRFRRRFRRYVGRSPRSYLLDLRMAHAAFLLETTGCSVTEAAAILGYSDPFAFSRQFKRTLGMPPSHRPSPPS